MKKIISISLIVLMILSLGITSFAARPAWVDSTGGLELDVVENESTVVVTGNLVGYMDITTFQFAFAFNSAKLSVKSNLSAADSGFTLGASTNYMYKTIADWGAPAFASGTVSSTATLVEARNWPGFRYANTKSNTSTATNYAASTKTSIFRVVLNKVGGADIAANDVIVYPLGIQVPKLGNGTSNANYNLTTPTYNELYTSAFTNYVPVVTGYVVSYNTNGGDSIAAEAEATTLPATLPTPVKAGYDFAGWYTDAGLTTAAVAGATISQATTLFAKWTVAPITTIDPIAPISKAAVKADIEVKNASGQTVTINAPVIAITGKVPASVDSGNIASHEFGVIFGGVKFRSMSTWAGLNGNGGKYIIKLVDPTGKIPAGTYKAQNYLDAEISGDTSVVIGN